MLARRWSVWLVLMGVVLLASLAASYYSYNYWRNYMIAEGDVIVSFFPTPTRAVSAQATPLPEEAALPKPWDGKERLNILLMGIDQRANDRERVFRTDTMLILSIDPVTMEAGMLSVPRDLWVTIPGYQNNRINVANQLGDADDYPGGGGPQLARKTVESVLGVRIHFYVRLNFTVFESFIDRLGGVEIDVPNDIYDDKYPTEDFRTEVFELKAGRHLLDGATALKYARTRHDANGDFGRARRQQQVILAIREKVQDPRVFASLVASAPDLIADFGSNVKTNLTLDQMQQLAVLAQKLDRKNIKSAVLDQQYTEFATTPEGYQVLIARRDKIAELRDSFFRSRPVSAANVTATP